MSLGDIVIDSVNSLTDLLKEMKSGHGQSLMDIVDLLKAYADGSAHPTFRAFARELMTLTSDLIDFIEVTVDNVIQDEGNSLRQQVKLDIIHPLARNGLEYIRTEIEDIESNYDGYIDEIIELIKKGMVNHPTKFAVLKVLLRTYCLVKYFIDANIRDMETEILEYDKKMEMDEKKSRM